MTLYIIIYSTALRTIQVFSNKFQSNTFLFLEPYIKGFRRVFDSIDISQLINPAVNKPEKSRNTKNISQRFAYAASRAISVSFRP